MTGTASEKGNTVEEIIDEGGKKDREWGKVLKGPPRVWSITQAPPAIPLPFGDDTVKCPCLHWGGNRINAPNNYTDIPGKPVLSAKAVLQMRIPQCNRPGNVPHKC